jgi:hypothetical protein
MPRCYICSRLLTETNEHHEYKGYCSNCILTMKKEKENEQKRNKGHFQQRNNKQY